MMIEQATTCPVKRATWPSSLLSEVTGGWLFGDPSSAEERVFLRRRSREESPPRGRRGSGGQGSNRAALPSSAIANALTNSPAEPRHGHPRRPRTPGDVDGGGSRRSFSTGGVCGRSPSEAGEGRSKPGASSPSRSSVTGAAKPSAAAPLSPSTRSQVAVCRCSESATRAGALRTSLSEGPAATADGAPLSCDPEPPSFVCDWYLFLVFLVLPVVEKTWLG